MGNSQMWQILASIHHQSMYPMHSCPHVSLSLATSLCRPLVLTCSIWPVLLSGMNCCHLGPYVYMLIFSHTREPDSCSFLQYGYFSFDKCFPWWLTISSACTHLRNPQWQEHTHGENIFTSPGAVDIINYLFFCQSSICKLFWGWGFLPSFVWLGGNRAPLGMWLCWLTPGDFKEIRMAQRRSAGPRTQKWTKVTNTKRWQGSGLGQRLGVLKTCKSSRAQGQHSYRA